MKNVLVFLTSLNIALSCHGMDVPLENGSTNQALAKYAGCFVAFKGNHVQGHPLAADKSLIFAYVHHNNPTVAHLNGYVLSVLKQRIELPEGMMCAGMPEGLCASPELHLRMATEAEIARAEEKINNNELQLGFCEAPMAVKLLNVAKAKIMTVHPKRKEDEIALRRSKRQRRPVQRLGL